MYWEKVAADADVQVIVQVMKYQLPMLAVAVPMSVLVQFPVEKNTFPDVAK